VSFSNNDCSMRWKPRHFAAGTSPARCVDVHVDRVLAHDEGLRHRFDLLVERPGGDVGPLCRGEAVAVQGVGQLLRGAQQRPHLRGDVAGIALGRVLEQARERLVLRAAGFAGDRQRPALGGSRPDSRAL